MFNQSCQDRRSRCPPTQPHPGGNMPDFGHPATRQSSAPPGINAAIVGIEDILYRAGFPVCEVQDMQIIISIPARGSGMRFDGGIGNLVLCSRLPICEMDNIGNTQVDRCSRLAGSADGPKCVDLLVEGQGGFPCEEQPGAIRRQREDIPIQVTAGDERLAEWRWILPSSRHFHRSGRPVCRGWKWAQKAPGRQP